MAPEDSASRTSSPSPLALLPPSLLAHLFSSWFNSSEAVRLLSVCRRWSLSGTDRRLLFGMIAQRWSGEEQTVNGADYREPKRMVKRSDGSDFATDANVEAARPLLLPWRQRHMTRVQHVCIRLLPADESASGDASRAELPSLAPLPSPRSPLPSFAHLPSPSSALPSSSFTLQSHPEFELRWTERRMMHELDVIVRVARDEPPRPTTHAALADISEESLTQQARLWSMLASAFESCSTPLSVTFIGVDRSKTPHRMTPIIALTPRWMADAESSLPSSDETATSTGSAASSLESKENVSESSSSESPPHQLRRGPLRLRLHSLIFRTGRLDFIHATISYLRQTTGSDSAVHTFANPLLSEAHRQWYAEGARKPGGEIGWTAAQIDAVHARNLLVPLNVLFFHSDDPVVPTGLPPLVVDLIQSTSSGLNDASVARYALHSIFVHVAHPVPIREVIDAMMHHPVVRTRELYLLGLKLGMETDMASLDAVQRLVLRGREINSFGDPHPLPFSVAVRLLSNGFRRLRSIELIDYSFYGPAALHVWAPLATQVRLERCSFDDDDGLIDLTAHAQSLWATDAVPRMQVLVLPTTLGLFCRRLVRDNRAFPLIFGAGILFFFLPLLLVDVMLSWLFPMAPGACYARFFNLVLIESTLVYCFIKCFVFPGTWGLPRAPTPYSPPPTRVLRLLGFGPSWVVWMNSLVSIPSWPCHPMQAVVYMSSLKMLMSSLTAANSANWDRVQRARSEQSIAASLSYFSRLTMASSMQLIFFLPMQHTILALWRFMLVMTSSAMHLRFVPAFTPFAVHSLATHLFVDSIRCVDARAPVEVALPRAVPSLLKQVFVTCTEFEPVSWLKSWWDASAWVHWTGRLAAALPTIVSLALVLFALQVSVRRLRRAIRARWVKLQWLAEPLLVADGLLWW